MMIHLTREGALDHRTGEVMVNIYEIGRFYGRSRPYGARQALRCEALLSWGRTKRLVFLAGFGRGRQEIGS